MRESHHTNFLCRTKHPSIMKTIVAILVVVILGIALGAATAVFRLGPETWVVNNRVARRSLPRDTGPEGTPRSTVDHEEYEFGTMDADVKGTHDFLFTNTGDGTLDLTVGDTSCRCTMSKLAQSSVPPGQSTKVTMTWTAEEVLGPYRQTATIFTNDPARPRVTLTVSGRITAAVRVVPQELVFSSVSAGQSATAEAELFCYLQDPLEILGFKLADTSTAEQFEVAFEPLSADRLAEDPDAHSGQLVKVILKPGLPQGPFQQKILIRTNLEASPAVVLPIEGVISSEIAVVGRGYDQETGVLTLGTVDGQTGVQRRLMLIVRGPYRKEVKFQPAKITPDSLKVEFGKATQINNDTVMQVPMTIRIPPGTGPAAHLGSKQGKLGEILLETNHPRCPQLRILVRFAVEG